MKAIYIDAERTDDIIALVNNHNMIEQAWELSDLTLDEAEDLLTGGTCDVTGITEDELEAYPDVEDWGEELRDFEVIHNRLEDYYR